MYKYYNRIFTDYKAKIPLYIEHIHLRYILSFKCSCINKLIRATITRPLFDVDVDYRNRNIRAVNIAVARTSYVCTCRGRHIGGVGAYTGEGAYYYQWAVRNLLDVFIQRDLQVRFSPSLFLIAIRFSMSLYILGQPKPSSNI